MKVWHLLVVVLLCFSIEVARAQTIDISDGNGGLISAYQNQWAALAAQGVRVRIVGPCVSACTILLSYVSRRNICVTPNAYLGFHWATTAFHTQELWSAYPPDIRQWISQHGGLTDHVIWLQAPAIYRYFRRC
jgi:hypothetical protein